MEEFVALMKKNTKSLSKEKFTKNRELVNLVTSKVPPSLSKISKGEDLGDLCFSAPLQDLGITFEVFSKYQEELFSPYVGNLLGELLIRENLDMFAEILTNLEAEDYIPVVYSGKHKKFGLEICEEDLVFRFHSSLLQKILTEDLREKI